MKVIDAGHRYELRPFDGGEVQALTFMKREGPGYPGNVGHYGGTNCQEVLRALIDRMEYLQHQISCGETEGALFLLRQALWLFEGRAARRHGRLFDYPVAAIENEATCKRCGHIGCVGGCQKNGAVDDLVKKT